GDSVTVVKDLKVKGSSSMLKIGTKVKNIRLVEGDHNIDCKIDEIISARSAGNELIYFPTLCNEVVNFCEVDRRYKHC
ncbi:PhnA domain-containing protein, partial [Klebsiella pneumoniae]|uniref:PhnA domain-containing protein n=1 Tax=Klebsiella pneumoniae TaxID=573 RepID=UPI003EE01F23